MFFVVMEILNRTLVLNILFRDPLNERNNAIYKFIFP